MMEEWEKYWQNLLDQATKEVGHFCQQMVDQVEKVGQETIETVELLAEEFLDLIDLELENLSLFLDDLVNEEFDDNDQDHEENSNIYWSNLRADQSLNNQDEISQETNINNLEDSLNSLNSLDSFEIYHTPKIEPCAGFHPACIGCKNYHGHVYGRNLLVCGMHPYGWDDDNCPDFSS